MKILLLCGGGFSTSILMNKMRKWAEQNNEDITIDAKGKEAYESIYHEYDCILLGPQISYCLDDIKNNVSIPVAGIPSIDYAVGNAENVVNLAKKITGK